MSTTLKLGVIGTSRKESEFRRPIHPEHLQRIPEQIRRRLIFEHGYGQSFGVSDNEIRSLTGGTATRHELLADLGVVVLPKPVLADFRELREGGILWGWPHCVQQRDITQVGVDLRQTFIAFEAMFDWGSNQRPGRHTFHENNELAGYCAVSHGLQLRGINGHYGNQRKVLIFGFGAVSRGAICALKALGFEDITVCVRCDENKVLGKVPDCHYLRIRNGGKGEARMLAIGRDGTERSLLDVISEAEIIVNGILQDPDHSVTFVTAEEILRLKAGCLIIDISCDEGMGFSFAKPTTFKNPMFKIGTADYYGVDHTPSYLWESATRSLSEGVLPYLATILAGREAWQENQTIRRAVEIDAGVIQNPKILSFQNRQPDYPHEPIETEKSTRYSSL